MLRFSIVILLTVLSQFHCGQARIQCKGLGQYCTAHSDCCSNSCLSFSYKCVERHDHSFDARPPATINSIDELVNRFGDNDDATTSNTYHTHPTPMPSTSSPVETNQPELSTNEIDHSESICRDNGFSCLHSDQCCSNFCSKITNECIYPTPNSLSTEQVSFTKPAVAVAPPSPCYGIGHKCYSPIECCQPLRCHGYLHQCVT